MNYYQQFSSIWIWNQTMLMWMNVVMNNTQTTVAYYWCYYFYLATWSLTLLSLFACHRHQRTRNSHKMTDSLAGCNFENFIPDWPQTGCSVRIAFMPTRQIQLDGDLNFQNDYIIMGLVVFCKFAPHFPSIYGPSNAFRCTQYHCVCVCACFVQMASFILTARSRLNAIEAFII